MNFLINIVYVIYYNIYKQRCSSLFQSRWWMAEMFQLFAMIEHTYEYTYIRTIFSAHVPRCILGAGGRRRGGRAGEKGRPDRDGDFETCVMAFLVLSCIRTLTLLAYIRAWSWLPSAFLSSSNHTYSHVYMCPPCSLHSCGMGAYRTRISLRELTRWRQYYMHVYLRI